MLKKLKFIPLLFALSLLSISLAPTPAHAEVGPEIWTKTWTMDGCNPVINEDGKVTGDDNGCVSATFTVLNGEYVVIEEHRTDRASRYYRVESAWPSPAQYQRFPNAFIVDNEAYSELPFPVYGSRTVLPLVQPEWNRIHGWTSGVTGKDTTAVALNPGMSDVDALT